MVVDQKWPVYDESKCKEDQIEIVVQVNGKIKAKLMISADAEQTEVLALAKIDENVKKSIDGMNIIKEIYVKGRLVNIVVKP
jgi:leucyl-tRNA synthetase